MKARFVCSSLVFLLAWPALVIADEPTPSSCTVSSIVACPAGDLPIRIVVRKGKARISRSVVTLDMGACTELRLAAYSKQDAYKVVDGWRLVTTANDEGVAEFRIRAGRAFACSRIPVVADGVIIAERTALASPDQNGDLLVDDVDISLLRLKIGKSDPTGDLNGDGRVNLVDVALARTHLGHHADIATPAKVTTWGEIKAGYR